MRRSLVKVTLPPELADGLRALVAELRAGLPPWARLSEGSYLAERVRTDLANRKAARKKAALDLLWRFEGVWKSVAANWFSKLKREVPLEDLQDAAREEALKGALRFDPALGFSPAPLIRRYAHYGIVHFLESHWARENPLIRPDGDEDGDDGSRWDRIESEEGDPDREHQRGQVRTALAAFLKGKPAKIQRAVRLMVEFDDDAVSVRSGLSLAEIAGLRMELAAALGVEVEQEISLKAAAKILKKEPKAVYALIEDGVLPARKRDGRWQIRPSELRAYLRGQEAEREQRLRKRSSGELRS